MSLLFYFIFYGLLTYFSSNKLDLITSKVDQVIKKKMKSMNIFILMLREFTKFS